VAKVQGRACLRDPSPPLRRSFFASRRNLNRSRRDEPQREPIDVHVMPREQKMHRELIAGRDPPDQRLVRCGLHPGVSALVAAAEDRVQNGEPGGGGPRSDHRVQVYQTR